MFPQEKIKLDLKMEDNLSDLINTERNIAKLKISGSLSYKNLAYLSKMKDLLFLDISDAYVEDNTIPACAFEGNYFLKQILLPKTLINIGDSAFMGAFKLEQVRFSNNIEKIGTGAFSFSKLIDVYLPEKLTKLEDYTLGCTTLKTIYLPKDLEEIGKGNLPHLDGFIYSFASKPPILTRKEIYFNYLHISYSSEKYYDEDPNWDTLKKKRYVRVPSESIESKNEYHLSIMGIEIDEYDRDFENKLENKGFKKIETEVFSGSFINKECNLFASTNLFGDINYVEIKFKEKYKSWSTLKSEYKRLKELYEKKYGNLMTNLESFEEGYYDGEGLELFALENGKVNYISYWPHIYGKGSIMIILNRDCTISISYLNDAHSYVHEVMTEKSNLNEI